MTNKTGDEWERPPRSTWDEGSGQSSLAKTGVIAVVVLLLLMAGAYMFVIPRMEVLVKTRYFESFGPTISVDAKIENTGNVRLENIEFTLAILDEQDHILENLSKKVAYLDGFSTQAIDSIGFKGDHYQIYTLLITIRFNAGGKTYYQSYSHVTDSSMNILYEDWIRA